MSNYVNHAAIALGLKNRRTVFFWFVKNPCKTRVECSEALDMPLVTVQRHAQAIRAGWKPEELLALEAQANGR